MDRKVYNRTYWVDHETPVNAKNLNKIEKAIYDLSEQSLRPNDFSQKEGSAIIMSTECGKIGFDVDSTVLRTDGTLNSFGIIKEEEITTDTTVEGGESETKNNLRIFIRDLMEGELDPSYRLFYNGVEYFPELVKSNSVICEDEKNLEDHLSDRFNALSLDLSNSMNSLKDDIAQSLTNSEEEIQNQLASIQKKLNTLSLKIEMLESMINDLEDNNNEV